MNTEKIAAHALFDIAWSNMDDRDVVEQTLKHIRNYVHTRVNFWNRQSYLQPRMTVEEQWRDNLQSIVDHIQKTGYGRLLTLYALFACRMGMMIIHTQQLLLPRIVAPIRHDPGETVAPSMVIRWAEMANDNIYNGKGFGEHINVKDLPMFEKLYPSEPGNTISDSMASTFRSLHYESVATLAEQAIVELFTRITLMQGVRTTLGHDLMDILDRSDDRDVERRVFRWYRQFVPVTTFFPEKTAQMILCNQSGMCRRRDQTNIEGGRTPQTRPAIRYSSTPTAETSIPWDDMHTIIQRLFPDANDKAQITNIWTITRMQRPLVICALMHYQLGDVYADPSEARTAYHTLLHYAPLHIALTNGKSQLFEEDVCLSTLQLVSRWVDHLEALPNGSPGGSSTHAMFSFLDRVFPRPPSSPPATTACPPPVNQDRSIGITIGSVLHHAMGGLIPKQIAETVCSFVSLQAFIRFRPVQCVLLIHRSVESIYNAFRMLKNGTTTRRTTPMTFGTWWICITGTNQCGRNCSLPFTMPMHTACRFNS
jgi:hypothetical protein